MGKLGSDIIGGGLQCSGERWRKAVEGVACGQAREGLRQAINEWLEIRGKPSTVEIRYFVNIATTLELWHGFAASRTT